MDARAALFACGIAAPFLAGCGSVAFYDEGKDKAADSAKTKYSDAKLTEALNNEETNLDKLLAAEIKAIAENRALQLDIRFLRMANDRAPMARSVALWADTRVRELGFTSAADIRKFLTNAVDVDAARGKLKDRADIIAASTRGFGPPPCQPPKSLPAEMPPLPFNPSPTARANITVNYPEYVNACAELQRALGLTAGGELNQAMQGLQEAERRAADIKVGLSAQKTALTEARKAYELAVAAGKVSPDAVSGAQIKAKADLLNEALETAKKFDDRFDLGVLPGERVKAISSLLVATASGKVDPAAQADKNLSSALVVAATAPALVDSVQDLKTKAQAPPVAGLLIELRHQALLVDHSNKRLDLVDRRAALAKAKYQTLLAEARQWLDFKDALCNLAKPGARGPECDTFEAGTGDPITCTTQGPSGTGARAATPNCPYARPWNTVLDTGPAETRRAADRAVAALVQAQALRSQGDEIDFRLVDVEHREALAANRMAIQAWNNLIAGPTEQLAAYYKSGLKPYEIGDLIVKALGLTAIAIGVAQ